MTKGSLRALLEGAIDYAGMFPPASLSLHDAVAEFRARRTEPEAWLLGHFVCPAEKLRDLLPTCHDQGFTLSLSVPRAYTVAAYRREILPSVSAVRPKPTRRYPLAPIAAVQALEFRWQVNVIRDEVIARPDNLLALASALTAIANPEAKMYFELSRIDSAAHLPAWERLLERSVCALREHNVRADLTPRRAAAGYKLRCGGERPADFPSSAEVAEVIQRCRDVDIFWKATAGLHHPLRHFDPALAVPVHGFVNLFTAAVLADVHRLKQTQIQAILEDEEASDFHFDDDELRWRELSATNQQISAARQRGLQSFGSCSIEEPIQDLKALGWL